MAKRRRKYQPRRYHYDGMEVGVMSLEEHVAVELMGDVVTLNVKLTCLKPDSVALASSPWHRLPDNPDDPGYVVQVRKEDKKGPWCLTVVRETGKKWRAQAPTKPGEQRFRFSHDDRTVVVHVTTVGL